MIGHPYFLSDLVFVVIAIGIAAFTKRSSPYWTSNSLLAGQFMLVIGFSTFLISAGYYDGAYFDITLMIVYFAFYHLITRLGDRFLGGLSIIIGAYHFSLLCSGWFGLDLHSFIVLDYSVVMNGFMVMQLILAFRGLLYGFSRSWVSHDRRRGDHHSHSNK